MSLEKRERSPTPSFPERERTQTLSPLSPPAVHTRKRERSQTPSSPSSSETPAKHRHTTDLTIEVCKEFRRNACKRSEIDCKFAHPHSAVSIEGDNVIVCGDSLRNKCYRGRTCRYYHPPPHIQGSLLKASGVQDPKVEAVCKDFIRGRCLRSAKNCRFAHHTPIDHCAIVCQDFIRGNCEHKSCKFSHVLVAEKPEVCQDFIRGKCERIPCRYSHFVVHEIPQICQDFLRGRCDRRTCRYTHVLVPDVSQVHFPHYGIPMEIQYSPPRTEKDQEVLQVCKDFLNNVCNRESCKYAHPDSKTKVVSDQVEVCRDFRRGICHRTVCRFYHPKTANAPN